MDQDKRLGDALTKQRRPWLTAGIVAASVVALSGVGVGAYAIVQSVAPEQRVAAQPTAEPEAAPTPTEEPNTAPTADYIVSSFDGLTLTLDASTSADTDGTIASYAWDLGDGNNSSGVTTSHTYAAAGTYSIAVTVTDDAGDSTTFTAAIDVTAPPPPPAAPSTPTYGNYPPGYPMPNLPGTDSPDTSACASSTGTVNAQGQLVCA